MNPTKEHFICKKCGNLLYRSRKFSCGHTMCISCVPYQKRSKKEKWLNVPLHFRCHCGVVSTYVTPCEPVDEICEALYPEEYRAAHERYEAMIIPKMAEKFSCSGGSIMWRHDTVDDTVLEKWQAFMCRYQYWTKKGQTWMLRKILPPGQYHVDTLNGQTPVSLETIHLIAVYGGYRFTFSLDC